MSHPSTRSGIDTLPIRFVGSGSEYFRIWIVNLLLTLVTLGLYYPFAKLRRLRYFHRCTEVDLHPLEFHGNPWAMLRGYALVVVLAFVYGLAQQASELAGGVALLVLAAIGPALWHSSLRFRLANTSWRGVRLAFTGTLREAYVVAAPAYALALAVVLLMMLLGPQMQGGAAGPLQAVLAVAVSLAPLSAAPWMLWRAKRYQHSHYRFADEVTRFRAPLAQFYGVFLRTGLVALALGGAIAVLVGVGMTGLLGALGGKGAGAMFVYVLAVGVALLMFQVLARSYFAARMQNLVWTQTGNSHLRFVSRLRARSLCALAARNWALMLLTLGLYYPFAAVATARLRLQAVTLDTRLDLDRLLADPRRIRPEAAGDAAADVLGVDIGL